MSNNASINSITIQEWITAKLEPQAVEESLRAKGYDALSIKEHLKEFKRLRNEKRQFTGFVCMAVGAFLGFLSCVLTLVNAVPALYNYILFGLTFVAITIIVIGLYLVFE